MEINDNDIAKLEKLSKIKLDGETKESFKKDLSQIITTMECLKDINTSNIDLHSNLKTPLRDDNPIASILRKEVLKNAPNANDGFFIVHKII